MRAFHELPVAYRPASTTQARLPAAGRDRLLSAHSRAAATATTAPTLPPLAVRVGHGAASSPERRRQSPNGSSTWSSMGSAGADRGLHPSSPSQRAPFLLGIHFPEKPVSPRTALPQLTPQCQGAPLPDPGPGGRYLPVGLRRRNPVRGDQVAGDACSLLPVSSASGAVVKWRPKLTPLAANPIQFHSPPSALPVRARPPRDPPFPPLPRASAPLTHSLSPCPPSAPPSPPATPATSTTTTSLRLLSSLGLSSSPLCSFLPPIPLPSAASQVQLAAFPLFALTLACSLTPSLTLSAPSPGPCRVCSSLSLSRADVTT